MNNNHTISPIYLSRYRLGVVGLPRASSLAGVLDAAIGSKVVPLAVRSISMLYTLVR